jgi:hypothetical protein
VGEFGDNLRKIGDESGDLKSDLDVKLLTGLYSKNSLG